MLPTEISKNKNEPLLNQHLLKWADLHKNIILPTTHPYWSGHGWASITPKLFFKKRSRSVQKIMFTSCHPSWGGVEVNLQFLLAIAWNIQTCTEKSHSLALTSHGVERVKVSIFKENRYGRNWVKYPKMHKKLMFGNLTIGKGWG